jgi:integrase
LFASVAVLFGFDLPTFKTLSRRTMNQQSDDVSRGVLRPDAVWIACRKGVKGKTYSIRWIDPASGKAKSETCGSDKAKARDRKAEKRDELRKGMAQDRPRYTVDDMVDMMPTWMTGKASDTVKKTQQSLRELGKVWQKRVDDGKVRRGPLMVDGIGRELLMVFRASRADSVSSATVNKDMRQIKSAMTYAVDADWIPANPFWRWKAMQLRESEKVVRIVEKAEFEKLLAVCENPSVRVMLVVAYYEGLRRREVCNLRWDAVDFDKGVLRVVNNPEAGELTKSRKNRVVPMLDIVKRNLQAVHNDAPKILDGGKVTMKYPHVFVWPNGNPYKADWLTHAFAKLVEAAGIPHCTPHDLRRSFSTLMQRAGVDKATVKDLGGWSAISVIEKHYTGNVDEALHAAMRKREAAGA